jgi:hypothetical protein
VISQPAIDDTLFEDLDRSDNHADKDDRKH